MIKLEVPVYTVEAAMLAAQHGADRLELCADIGEGGTTPSVGLLCFLKERVTIPIMVMIRPRGGDFCYSEEEVQVMEKDIRLLDQFGADGFVFGVLTADGSVDEAANGRLLRAAGGKPCTFHRAIDVSKDPMEALEAVIRCGFQRVLSSGARNSVGEGLDNLKTMMCTAGDRLIVMPGGGAHPDHLRQLATTGYLREVHSSGKTYRPTLSRFESSDVELSADPESFRRILTVSPEKLQAYRREIESLYFTDL
ncbi:Cytoplasmic copper homeostasis protein cutC [Lunatimonas lonarensis]|uniref:PF03932 family protein CutC n=1 Tax=Lunatimonas lonarensis TaxID=1232681 RepID=R7ZWM3_9BACT|nr:copper homeostasis protein CutC [Lunatimonas lonarensis]EON78545.1 Cytoplasmic copper homeostasis protein cutC [Lunatimonas lonarensis]